MSDPVPGVPVPPVAPPPSVTDAVVSGVEAGLVAAVPAVAVAATATNPTAQLVIGMAQAFEPAIAQMIEFRDKGLMTDADLDAAIANMQKKLEADHAAWVSAAVAKRSA